MTVPSPVQNPNTLFRDVGQAKTAAARPRGICDAIARRAPTEADASHIAAPCLMRLPSVGCKPAPLTGEHIAPRKKHLRGFLRGRPHLYSVGAASLSHC
jgi:hypothetical protein